MSFTDFSGMTPAQWALIVLLPLGVVGASLTFLCLFFRGRRQDEAEKVEDRDPTLQDEEEYDDETKEADEEYLQEHSILPNTVPRSTSDSDPFSDGSFTERRLAPRRHGKPVLVLLSDEQREVEPVKGHVIDRSVSGLGLQLEEEGEVEPGTVISVRPKDAPEAAWVKLIVRNCERNGSLWRLGCEFVRPPDGISLMQFG
jgi:hypothetical protein